MEAAIHQLRLFVSGTSWQSVRAVECLRQVCETALQGDYELEVIDVLERPDLAESAKVTATPTLIKELPQPARRFIGDLADVEKLMAGLDLLDRA